MLVILGLAWLWLRSILPSNSSITRPNSWEHIRITQCLSSSSFGVLGKRLASCKLMTSRFLPAVVYHQQSLVHGKSAQEAVCTNTAPAAISWPPAKLRANILWHRWKCDFPAIGNSSSEPRISIFRWDDSIDCFWQQDVFCFSWKCYFCLWVSVAGQRLNNVLFYDTFTVHVWEDVFTI